jgi:ATP-binding cassette subfamily C protein LapB
MAGLDQLSRRRLGKGTNEGDDLVYADGVATPVELSLAAEESGLQIRYAERPLASLAEADFPCLALGRNGLAATLLGRQGDMLIVGRGGDVTALSLARLSRSFAGVIFHVGAADAAPGALRQAPEAGAQEPASGRSLIRAVLADLLSHRRRLLAELAVATALGNLFLIALPMFSMSVYDRVVPHLAMETLWALSVGIAVILAMDMIVRFIRLKLLDAASLAVSVPLQARLYARVLFARIGATPVTPGMLGSAVRDIEAICQCAVALVVSLAIDLPWFVGLTILLYAISGAVAVTPCIGLAILALVHVFGLSRHGEAAAAASLAGRQMNQAGETLGALETAKATTAERQLLRQWERLADEAAYASHRQRLTNGVIAQASLAVNQSMIVLALIIGVYEIGNSAISIGALTASTLLVGRMIAPMSQLMALFHRLAELGQCGRSVERILNAPQEVAAHADGQARRTPAGLIELRRAGLTYPDEQAPCLSGLTLRIAPGERVAIIGRIGSGKSSLMRLMMRLQDSTEGTISLDGYDIRQYRHRDIRRSFGYMRQDTVLFDDTLRANLCFGLDNVDPSAFERAVTISGVKEFAARHASGYGLRVGPRGERLSGGERQSVALARVLLGNSKVLMLDEPTAAMDITLEAMVVRELAAFAGGRTLVIATHRAPLLALVDRIVWLENGRLVADGAKEDVIGRLKASA